MFSLLIVFNWLQTFHEWFASPCLCDDYTWMGLQIAIPNCPFVTFPVELRNPNISASHRGGYFTAAGSEL